MCLAALSATTVMAAAQDAEVYFEDVAPSANLDFIHHNGMAGEFWLLEVNGAGVGVLDFDGDGRQDLWLLQGGPIANRGGDLPMDQLFRNVSEGSTIAFENVTADSGVRATQYAMGIATGDVDGDGDLDVFLANYGANQLYENLGDGRFRDVTSTSGISGNQWSTAAAFADVDLDGRLDLFVVNYVEFDLSRHRVCHDLANRPTYCTPGVYQATGDRLYRNLGGLQFEDISVRAGISKVAASGLGVISGDFNADGAADIYVANDAMDNHLWLNDGRGRFEEAALLAGVAVNGDGAVEASMGVDAQDHDGDCDLDLFVTHLSVESNTLYANDGTGWFVDQSSSSGLAAPSIPFTGFGTGWFDADLDGDLDLFAVNGAVTPIAAQRAAGSTHPLRQRDQFWQNDGTGHYRELAAGPAFQVEDVSRGAALVDLDNDGDQDIVVMNNDGPARVYRNNLQTGHWVGVSLPPASGPGARIRLADEDCGSRRWRTDGSYASAGDPRIVFGTGRASQDVVVHWRNGQVETFTGLMAGRYHLLVPGRGSK
ncbi:MAG: CRTAC1 family protein [Proteobacteria bacterium]|nr:CRTAC1 family protein [Pseudomonadota bacterium]